MSLCTKYILILVCIISPVLCCSQQLNGPETIVYDSLFNRHLVSNMNTDYIIEIDPIGNQSIFHTNLTHSYGMTIADSILYTVCDRGSQGGIVGIHLATGEEVFTKFAGNWYYSLNGLTADTSGNLYVACTGESRIYKISRSTGAYVVLVNGGVSLPNAVYYDRRNHRLLATSNVWWTPVYQVSLPAGTVTGITATTGQFSGITEDALHNYYIAFFGYSRVYKFDSLFSEPPTTIINSINGPEGIAYDNYHSQLCIPVLMSNYIEFLPLQVDAWIEGDVTYGGAPLTVQYTGSSVYDIAEWNWEFGDGQSGDGPSPVHVYETPGQFDIRLEAITTTDDTINHVFPRQIYNLADTIWAEDLVLDFGNDIEAVVKARFSVPLQEMRIPIEYRGELKLVLDSFSTAGCLAAEYEVKDVVDDDPAAKRITFKFRPRNVNVPLYSLPGGGPLLKLYFHSVDPAVNQSSSFDLSGYSTIMRPIFKANGLEYTPESVNGSVTYNFTCGDINNDDLVNVGDAVYLGNFVFHSSTAPYPFEAGDVNCDESINIGDLVYMVNYIFRPDSPEPCETCP